MTIGEKIRYLLRPERAKAELLRGYDAAVADRLHDGWHAVNDAAENEISPSRDRIRARARDLERNSDIVNAALSAFERNVVSTGIVLQPTVMKPDGEEDEALNRAIEEAWWRWQGRCDTTDSYSFEDIQRMALRRWLIDGGMLLVKCYSKRDGFRLQIREVDELDGSAIDMKSDGGIFSGVEVTREGKIRAYHFSGFSYGSVAIDREGERVDASRVLYLRNRPRPSAIREVSPLAPAISIIAHLTSYIEAVTVKERMLACFGIAITKQDGGAGMGRGLTVDARSGSKVPRFSIRPGMVAELSPGEKIEAINPQNGAGANMTEFVRIQTRLLAASLGISYESLSRDMSGVSYSSARQALLDDQRTFKVWQDRLIVELCTPVYEAWLESEILAGRLPVRYADFACERERYLSHTWTPVGWEWVDPQKDITAQLKALDANLTTYQAVCAEGGRDWRDVLKQRKLEKDYMDSLGITGEEKEAGNG